ncbi:NLP/P60 hydrolase [Salipiger sp. CCB-MM3]|uniref:C40 family peptidase n=1 Tax=Salipiger sp. CCB-MM3 TaxID=1792508 RepID=UPI00080A97B0|nr:NlpC/P60 family protein [Salipiger sp. CCB-MM3]ANT61519.1 NLP/P60 hydrolase [Salipiger sp. CCB-MM3]
MDPRLTPSNGRVAAAHLQGEVEAQHFTEGAPASVSAPVTDLLRTPGGARDRQLVYGAALIVYERYEGWAFGQAQADGYVGFVSEEALGPVTTPTHRVATRATHAYLEPNMKTPDQAFLSLGAQLQVSGEEGRFLKTEAGFVPAGHLLPLARPEPDPVAVSERLLGTPYLWGGNSAMGIDCSGLVQAGLRACDMACPGDSDMQEKGLGETLAPGTPPKRGDLLFWKGHVAWVADPDTLLHANAYHMAVAFEPLAEAVARIEAQGDGPVTRHARLTGVLS